MIILPIPVLVNRGRKKKMKNPDFAESDTERKRVEKSYIAPFFKKGIDFFRKYCIINVYHKIIQFWTIFMEKKSKSEQLFSELRRRITNMPDGTSFPSIRTLMEEYKVSQLTVTSALNTLKSLGMLTANPRSGLIVNKPQVSIPRILILQPDWTRKAQLLQEATFLMEAARSSGFFPQIHFYDYQKNILEHLEEFDAELLLLCSTPLHYFTPESLVRITHTPIPVIVLDDLLFVEGVNSVCRNSGDSGVIAATCFYRKGHRTLVSLYSEPEASHITHGHHLFRTTALAMGCSVEEWNCKMRPGDYPDTKLKQFAKEFASGRHPCTGIYVSSSISAVILMEEFAKLGIRVPEDISLISVGDNVEAERLGLTVLAPISRQTAKETMKMAATLLYSRSNGGKFLQKECTPLLIERNSVKTITNEEHL